MLEIKRILVPIDWSEPSNCAFHLAASLARDYGAQLDVLYVVPLQAIMYGPPPESYFDHLRKDLHRYRPGDPKTPVQYLCAQGDPATVILGTAKETNCDAIVMATHGRCGLDRFLLGSVAEEVLRKAPCLVLTVNSSVSADAIGLESHDLVAQGVTPDGTHSLD